MEPITSKSWVLPNGASITAAELEGAAGLLAFLRGYYNGYEDAKEAMEKKPMIQYNAIQTLVLANLV